MVSPLSITSRRNVSLPPLKLNIVKGKPKFKRSWIRVRGDCGRNDG
jgi:hypothetical protein